MKIWWSVTSVVKFFKNVKLEISNHGHAYVISCTLHYSSR
jgi:predicted glycosyltransferase